MVEKKFHKSKKDFWDKLLILSKVIASIAGLIYAIAKALELFKD